MTFYYIEENFFNHDMETVDLKGDYTMKKIIKKGLFPTDDTNKYFGCSKCGCIFESTKDSYKSVPSDSWWEDIYMSKCPECKTRCYDLVNFDPEDLKTHNPEIGIM